MPTTPVYGFETPVDTDPNDVPVDLAGLAAQVEAALLALHDDSGWTALTLLNGFTAVALYTLQVRRVGKVAEVRGMVSVPGSGQSSAICSLPAAVRPATNRWLQAAVSAGNRAVVSPLIDAATGTILLPASYWSATPTGQVSITGSWLVG